MSNKPPKKSDEDKRWRKPLYAQLKKKKKKHDIKCMVLWRIVVSQNNVISGFIRISTHKKAEAEHNLYKSIYGIILT